MGRFLFLLFLAVPLIEIAFFVLIGNAIGLWPTLAGVLVTALIGSLVLRQQGMAVVNEIRGSVSRGGLPARALADGMLIAVAGILLLTPGYFTDLLGITLLVPAVRQLIYAQALKHMTVVTTTSYGFTQAGPGAPPRGGPRRVDDGTIDLDNDEWRPR